MTATVLKDLRCSLTLHFAVIAWLTAMLVAAGSGSYFLPAFIFCVSTAAYIFVDRLEWFELGRVGSYVGMLAATVFSVGSYFYSAFSVPSESGQLAAIAGLLVYPEAVLFLQRKSLRVYEQIAVFLLLEMIVAALVNDNLWFGVLLAPIMLMWVSSLFLFSRYATLVQMNPNLDEPTPMLAEILYRLFVKSVIGEKQNPQVVTTRPGQHSGPAGQSLRRILQSIPLGIGAMVFAGFFFYLLPRTGAVQFEPSLGPTARTGLPRTLNVGHVGRLLSDPTPVMRVSVSHFNTKKNYPLRQSPYIRARVMDSYGNASRASRFYGAEWIFGGVPSYLQLTVTQPRDEPLYLNRDRVRVEFDIRNQFAATLYSLPPAFATGRATPVPLRYDSLNMVLDEVDALRVPRSKSMVYEIGSSAFASGVQLPIVPALMSGSHYENHTLYNLTNDFSEFATCEQYRRRLIDRAEIDVQRPYELAKFVERHFTDGDFTYTLDLPPPVDESIDPIEDFLVNGRMGHCQYFASAMVMILRQSHIPSRIVVGYKPHEYNALGDYYSVKQSDAHAWVEALFSQEQLIGTELEGWATPAASYWVRFDPTPARAAETPPTQQGQAIDYAEKLWKDYVVEGQKLDSENSLYAPVSANSENAYASMVEQFKKAQQQVTSGQLWAGLARIGFAWQVAILITAVGVVGVLCWQTLLLLQRFAPRLAGRLGLRPQATRVQQAFYARCLDLLERRGLRRMLHETPREFTQRASLSLQHAPAPSGSAPLDKAPLDKAPLDKAPLDKALSRLTGLYYRMRFSEQQTLSPAEQQDVEQALLELANYPDTTKPQPG